MKKSLLKLPKYIIAYIFTLFLLVGNGYAEELPTILTEKANVYISASSPQVIAQKLKGEEIEVVSKSDSWYEIKLDDNINGWLRKTDAGIAGDVHNYTLTGSLVKSYEDETIKVSVEKISKYYVTKIWLQNPAEQIKKKEAGWGSSLTTVNSMLNATPGAIVGCNGSGFYKSGSWEPSQSAIKKTSWNKTTEGYLVISNGEIRRQISGQQCNALLGILPNGSLKYYENNPYNDVINDGVRNTFTFGPLLVKDGKAYRQAVGSPRRGYSSSAASLTTIGQIDANNFIIIETAGSSTAKLSEIADFGIKLGCNLLYNLDGGGSSSLWFRNGTTGNGTQVKSSSRGVGDTLYFISLKQ